MTDQQLIRAVLDGDVQLFAELVRRYDSRIKVFIFHMLKSVHMESLTEDMCQETFYKAYRNLKSFREQEAAFSTWLYTIARNSVISELRKHRGVVVSLDESMHLMETAQNVSPEQAVLSQEKVSLVRKAISNLSEKQRSALILREYNQLEYQEIAEILGQPVSSIKSLLFRARASVKLQLDSYYGDYWKKTYKEVERK